MDDPRVEVDGQLALFAIDCTRCQSEICRCAEIGELPLGKHWRDQANYCENCA